MRFVNILSEEEVAEIKKDIYGVFCGNACKGTGAIFQNNIFTDCICVKEFNTKINYASAGIPKKYWDFDLRNLTESFSSQNERALTIIKKYKDKLDLMVKDGVGLYIQGASGLAKTALSYYILKECIKKDIPCCGIRLSDLTRLLTDSLIKPEETKVRFLNNLRKNAKVLFLDEVEKDYKVTLENFAGQQLNEFLSFWYDKKRSLIVTSNVTKSQLKGIHADNIIDRFHELADVVFIGNSFRRPSDAMKEILS